MSSKPRGGRDVSVGQSLPSMTVRSVSADHMRLAALLLRDPNPIHLDIDAVRRAGLGDRLINQGVLTMAYVMNLLIAWAGSREAIERISCSFRGNVADGDDVVIQGHVTEVQPGVDGQRVTVSVSADVVEGRRALVGEATLLLRLTPQSSEAGA